MKQIQEILALVLIVIVMCNTSCTTQNLMHKSRIETAQTIFRNDTAYQYHIRKDDKVSVSVWDHDDMSVGSVYGIYNSNEVYGKWLLVDINGNINVPKLGEVHLEGLTIIEADTFMQRMYRKWIVEPIVDIKVLNKEVTVMGEFKTPGKYLLERDFNTLYDVIGKAGDLDFYADKRKVQVIRSTKGAPQRVIIDLTKASKDFRENIQIYPGDIVYVPSRKSKTWDKRSGSIIVPIAAAISSAVLINSLRK